MSYDIDRHGVVWELCGKNGGQGRQDSQSKLLPDGVPTTWLPQTLQHRTTSDQAINQRDDMCRYEHPRKVRAACNSMTL